VAGPSLPRGARILNEQPIAIRRVRDLSVFDVGEHSIVVACDSSGGIGPKDADTYYAPASVVAHFAVRVALLELLAAGATPVLVVDALCVEAEPTGSEMIGAARGLLAEIGLDECALLGSTEDNVPTRATGIGVTAIGVATRDGLRPGSAQAGDVVVCLGLPLSAPRHDVYPEHPQIVSVDEVRRVCRLVDVHDVLPVGSHGIRYELQQLAATARLDAEPNSEAPVDLDCSAGPGTCVLVSCSQSALPTLRELRADLPVAIVATLRAPAGP
jgi:selenophosphate synthetase-related protein